MIKGAKRVVTDKRSQKHIKILMKKIRILFEKKPIESSELIDEFTVFFTNKDSPINLNNMAAESSFAVPVSVGQTLEINNPMQGVIVAGYPKLLEVFLNHGGSPIFFDTKTGASLAEYALIAKSADCLKTLLDRAGYATLNAELNSISLLSNTVVYASYACLDTLLEHPSFRQLENAKRFEALNCKSNYNPLFAAVLGGHADIVRLLVKHGVNINMVYHGLNVFELSLVPFEIGFNEKNQFYEDRRKIVEFFLEKGLFNPLFVKHSRNPQPHEPLVCVFERLSAAKNCTVAEGQEVIKVWNLLLQHGAGICYRLIPDEIKITCKAPSDAEFIILSKSGQYFFNIDMFVEAFLKNGADFNVKSIWRACCSSELVNDAIAKRLKKILEENLSSLIETKVDVDIENDVYVALNDLDYFSLSHLEQMLNEAASFKASYRDEMFYLAVKMFKEHARSTGEHILKQTIEGLVKGEAATLNSTLEQTYFFHCSKRIDMLKSLCKMKIMLMNTSEKEKFIDKLHEFKKLFKFYIAQHRFTLLCASKIFPNDQKKLIALHHAIIDGLTFLKKHAKICLFNDDFLKEINTNIAFSVCYLLLDARKNGSADVRHFANVLKSLLPLADLSYSEQQFVAMRDSYAMLAYIHIEDGYYNLAKKFLQASISEAKKSRVIGEHLLSAAVVYLEYYLKRDNFVEVEELLFQLQQIQSDFHPVVRNYHAARNTKIADFKARIPILDEPNKVALQGEQNTMEIKLAKIVKRPILRLLDKMQYASVKVQEEQDFLVISLENVHRIFHEDFTALMNLLQRVCQQSQEKLLHQLDNVLQEKSTSFEKKMEQIEFQLSQLYFAGNPYKREKVRKIKVQPIMMDETPDEIVIDESEVSIEDIYRMLELPVEGYSTPVMIRSSNGGFPDNTHFLCIRNSKEFDKFLKPLHSREENVTYSIPEKGLGKRGVKIDKDNQEIRVKGYGDEQAFGKCVKEVRTKEGMKIRLYLVDEIKNHKDRARAQKRPAA